MNIYILLFVCLFVCLNVIFICLFFVVVVVGWLATLAPPIFSVLPIQ